MAIRKQKAQPAKRGPVSLEPHGDEQQLHLEGSVGIAQARALHALALEAATAGRPIVLHAQRLQRLDVAAAQVLLALRETVIHKGGRIAWSGTPASVTECLRRAGLTEAFGI